MKTIRAFLFDLDGVITDTAHYHYMAWRRLADEEGLPFTEADNQQLRGVSRQESLRRMLKGKRIDAETETDWLARKNRYYLDSLEELSPKDTLEGIVALLDDAKAAGLGIGLASASKNARLVLDKLQLERYFDVVGDGNSVVNTKPAPDLFVWVAGALEINPQEGVVFEDAEAGLQAARAGGFWTVGIGADVARFSHISYASTSEIRLADVLSRLPMG